MTPSWPIDMAWWIAVVEVPVLAGLVYMIWHVRKDMERCVAAHRDSTDDALVALRDRLADHRLEVARSYASIAHLKDVEQRLTDHLLRIEHKLDGIQADERAAQR
jgi:hypothetical protein